MTRDFDYHCEKFLIVGASEYGKSTLQMHLARNFKFQFPKSKKHRFFFDHKGQYQKSFGGFAARTHAEFCACIAQTGQVLFNPCVMFPENPRAGFKWFSKAIWDVQQSWPGNNHESLLVFDEFGILLPWERHAYEDHAMRMHIDTGREWRWNLICTSQCAGDMSVGARRQLTSTLALRHNTKASADVLVADYDFEFAKLKRLQIGEFIRYHNQTAKHDPISKLKL